MNIVLTKKEETFHPKINMVSKELVATGKISIYETLSKDSKETP